MNIIYTLITETIVSYEQYLNCILIVGWIFGRIILNNWPQINTFQTYLRNIKIISGFSRHVWKAQGRYFFRICYRTIGVINYGIKMSNTWGYLVNLINIKFSLNNELRKYINIVIFLIVYFRQKIITAISAR